MSELSRPTSGSFEGREHLFPLRVYYEDTDAAGIVYFANYMKFAERARSEFMRLCGLDHGDLLDGEGLIFAVRRAETDYFAPARLDDALIVRTRLIEMGAAYIDAEQRILRDSERLARVRLRVVCVTTAGRIARLPKSWRARFEDFAMEPAEPVRQAG